MAYYLRNGEEVFLIRKNKNVYEMLTQQNKKIKVFKDHIIIRKG